MPAIASASLTLTGAEQPPAPFTKAAFSSIAPSAVRRDRVQLV